MKVLLRPDIWCDIQCSRLVSRNSTILLTDTYLTVPIYNQTHTYNVKTLRTSMKTQNAVHGQFAVQVHIQGCRCGPVECVNGPGPQSGHPCNFITTSEMKGTRNSAACFTLQGVERVYCSLSYYISKIVLKMTHNVSSGTLNLYSLTPQGWPKMDQLWKFVSPAYDDTENVLYTRLFNALSRVSLVI